MDGCKERKENGNENEYEEEVRSKMKMKQKCHRPGSNHKFDTSLIMNRDRLRRTDYHQHQISSAVIISVNGESEVTSS